MYRFSVIYVIKTNDGSFCQSFCNRQRFIIRWFEIVEVFFSEPFLADIHESFRSLNLVGHNFSLKIPSTSMSSKILLKFTTSILLGSYLIAKRILFVVSAGFCKSPEDCFTMDSFTFFGIIYTGLTITDSCLRYAQHNASMNTVYRTNGQQVASFPRVTACLNSVFSGVKFII